MKQIIGIYGASGFGREVLAVLRSGNETKASMVFVDDGKAGQSANGCEIVDWSAFQTIDSDLKSVVLAIADGKIRAKLDAIVSQAGIPFHEVIAANAHIGCEAKRGVGAVLQPFTNLTANVSIGRHFHANIYSYVAHDCVIGDYVTFAPNVMCNGNVVIEDYAYIGTGAVLRQGSPDKPLTIGKGAVVGMGAVVTKDVPPETTVVGNPAKPLMKS